MDGLPHRIYTAAQVRELDRAAAGSGLAGEELMERAGAYAWETMHARWPAVRSLSVLCGNGNNGGDGYVVARLAHEAGLVVEVFQLGDPDAVQGEAAAARERLLASGVEPQPYAGQPLIGQLVVDALFGTGLRRPVEGAWRAAVDACNEALRPVVALDVPSGLQADTGAVLGACVQADLTVSFVGLTLGLFTGRGPAVTGGLAFSDLGLPAELQAQAKPVAERLDLARVRPWLAPRPRDAHKGQHGHVLVVGGEHGMAGAAQLAATAALRAGAGLVSVATRGIHAPLLSATRPELMALGVESPAELDRLLARATVLALGPGLGRGRWGTELLQYLLERAHVPLVLDADALNLIAEHEALADQVAAGSRPRVLTPHPGEAARLLACTVEEVQADRYSAVRALQGRFGGVWVLKGAGSLVAGAGRAVGVVHGGNPGMASGGMGDALTGIVAALLGQGLSAWQAAAYGATLHAAAADAAAEEGERGLLAGDLMPHIRRLCNGEAGGTDD